MGKKETFGLSRAVFYLEKLQSNVAKDVLASEGWYVFLGVLMLFKMLIPLRFLKMEGDTEVLYGASIFLNKS